MKESKKKKSLLHEPCEERGGQGEDGCGCPKDFYSSLFPPVEQSRLFLQPPLLPGKQSTVEKERREGRKTDDSLIQSNIGSRLFIDNNTIM